jgi:hypothetical protein
MTRNITTYPTFQVFLNYPFDEQFSELADAMSFSVVAAGMLPVCARDLTTPDRPRLEMLVEAIVNCAYSAHDLSRAEGTGPRNFARMNMPLEVGMALFHALQTQHRKHRCLLLVPTEHDYKVFASDLAGLDLKCHYNNSLGMLTATYEWLRGVVPNLQFNSKPIPEVQDKFTIFTEKQKRLRGSGKGGCPSHEEKRELMYQVCSKYGWWDWRESRHGKSDFAPVPLSFRRPKRTNLTKPKPPQVP